MKKLKKEIQNPCCRKKARIWIGRSLAAVVIFCGLAGTGRFSLQTEAAQEEAAQTASNAKKSGGLEDRE